MKQFMDQVPNDIFEAGKIDGASEWKLYTKIALPLLKNAQATAVILSFGGIWGDSATSNTYIYEEQMRTLAFFMGTIGGNIARTGATAVSSLIMTLPSIIIFVIQQSRVMDTMAHSGIK
jgi:ABC-type glycerol-3-phosphate transport system permease component